MIEANLRTTSDIWRHQRPSAPFPREIYADCDSDREQGSSIGDTGWVDGSPECRRLRIRPCGRAGNDVQGTESEGK